MGKRWSLFSLLLSGLVSLSLTAGMASQSASEATPVPPVTQTAHAASVYATATARWIASRSWPSIVQALEARNTNCTLTCFLGFRPGQTTEEEILAYLATLSNFDEVWQGSGDYESALDYINDGSVLLRFLGDTEIAWGFTISFRRVAGILEGMRVEFNQPGRWLSSDLRWIDLPTVLGQIDAVPEIYLAPNSRASDYTLYFVYREQHMQFRYEFDLFSENETGMIERFCADLAYTTNIQMLLDVPVSGLLDREEALNENHPSPYWTIERALGVSAEEFIQFFRDHPDDCLVIERNARVASSA